jgi:hypothetical protein
MKTIPFIRLRIAYILISALLCLAFLSSSVTSALAQAKRFCICVVGEAAEANPKRLPTTGKGEVTIMVKRPGQMMFDKLEADLSKIGLDSRINRAFSSDESECKKFEEGEDIVPVDSPIVILGILRAQAIRLLGNDKVGPVQGNCFFVTGDDASGPAGGRVPGNPDLMVTVMEAKDCPGVKDWMTDNPITLTKKENKVALEFTETEMVAANGDLVICITLINKTMADVEVTDLFLMLNWTERDGTPCQSPKYPGPGVFSLIKTVTIPAMGSRTPPNQFVKMFEPPKRTDGNPDPDVTFDPRTGTTKICWTLKKDTVQKKLPGFGPDLRQKYLAYIDFFGLPQGQDVIRSHNVWVKPKRIQEKGTTVGYNWYPTNPAFSTIPRNIYFDIDTDQTFLPSGWQIVDASPAFGPGNPLNLDEHEMRGGFFTLQIPSSSPLGTQGRIVIKGVDVNTGSNIMSDVTEIICVPNGTDLILPFCTLTSFIPGPPARAQITLQDLESGLATITVLDATNANIVLPAFFPGTLDPIVATATVIDPSMPASVTLEVADVAGNVTVCEQPLFCATDVSNQMRVMRSGFNFHRATGQYEQKITVKNVGATAIDGPLSLVLDDLRANANLFNSTGFTQCAAPLLSSFIDITASGPFHAGDVVTFVLKFTNPSNMGILYNTRVLAGSGVR